MIGRIHERRTFQSLGRRGRRAGAEHLWCRYLPDPALDRPHVAYAIARAVGPAVTRNRLRRRLRAASTDLWSTGQLGPGWWLIGVQPSASELTYDQLATELREITSTAARP